MNILITNVWLVNHAGTEVYVRDLAITLKNRGIHVEVYSPDCGPVAQEIRDAGILVTNNTRELQHQPDLIHAHHFIPTLDAILRFPDTPAVYFLHDRTNPVDTPPKHRNIVKYVAVDYNCLDRLVIDNGIPVPSTAVLFNWVDASRFHLREVFPEKPKKALVFSNTATTDNYYRIIKETCENLGIETEGIGFLLGSAVAKPEKVLPGYDLVFAKAKAAMEALSTGAGVIVCDTRGLGGMVNTENFGYYRKFNFGMKTLTRPVTPELIEGEIAKFDPQENKKAAALIRQDADLNLYTDRLLQVYHDAIGVFQDRKPDNGALEEAQTLHEYISQKKMMFMEQVRGVTTQLAQKTEEAEACQHTSESLHHEINTLKAELTAVSTICRRQQEEIDQLAAHVEACNNSISLRIGRMLGRPGALLSRAISSGKKSR